MVDIRSLNHVTSPDTYPLPLQTDITAAVRGRSYISTLDCAAFFHQWPVHREDQHKLTVVSHRGQESYKVCPIGYRNSPPYVQRQVKKLLRPHRSYAKGYIDDIVVFSKSKLDHMQHLRNVFRTLQDARIVMSPKKTYLGYPTANLLGQRVDSLGLVTTKEKIEAIRALKFPRNLRALETYLGLTGWLRNYIRNYAQIVQPLQQRKTNLLKESPSNKGNTRKNYSTKTAIPDPTKEELAAFQTLQQQFQNPTFLHHFDPERRLYVDLDACKD